jgi:hypothetical protein
MKCTLAALPSTPALSLAEVLFKADMHVKRGSRPANGVLAV